MLNWGTWGVTKNTNRNSKNRIYSLLLFSIGLILISGCRQKFPSGHYEGNLALLSTSESGQSHSVFKTEPVGIDVTNGWNFGIAEIKDMKDRLITVLKVTNFSSHGFTMTIPPIQSEPFHLKKEGHCYSDHSTLRVDLCFDHHNFLIKVIDPKDQNKDKHKPLFLLSGNAFTREARFKLETPRKITTNEAVNHALSHNFESKIEFQRLIQAKKSAQAAYLSLLPRISVGTAVWLSIDPMSLATGLIAGIGDLAPFLLPTRWLQAKESSALAHAEKLTMTLMQADLATQVEGLSYLYERDRQISSFYPNVLKEIRPFRDQIADAEAKKHVPEGSTVDIDDLINLLEINQLSSEAIVKADLYAFALALGFHNPEGIQEISVDPDPMSLEEIIENNLLPNSEDVAKLALRRSFELKQIDFIREAARHEKLELWFNWIDPQGDSKYNLGPGLIPSFKVANSKLHELRTQRHYLQTQIVQKAYETVATYIGSVKSHRLTMKHYKTSDYIIHDAIEKPLTEEFDAKDFHDRVLEYVSAYIDVETLIANFRIARSKLDRMRLDGYYLKLLPQSPENEIGDEVKSRQTLL